MGKVGWQTKEMKYVVAETIQVIARGKIDTKLASQTHNTVWWGVIRAVEDPISLHIDAVYDPLRHDLQERTKEQ